MERDSDVLRTPERELVAPSCVNKLAFAILYERYAPGLCRYLIALTGDTDAAADLTQEAFLSAYVHLSELTEPDRFPAWLYQIARNELRMQQRRAAIIHIRSIDSLPLGVVDRIAACQRPDVFTTCEAWDELQTALARLSPSHRNALLLNRVAGFTTVEIAEMLGIQHDTARKRVTRAVRALQARAVHD
jgi:RNA polymerase sigma-70 factor (ECF subfamily)